MNELCERVESCPIIGPVLHEYIMAAPGKFDLDDLIKTMSPTLEQKEYVFAKLAKDSPNMPYYIVNLRKSDIKMLFQEAEGWTMILPKSSAISEGLQYECSCRQVTLNVHSSLEAVGFLAAITTRLAKNLNIGVNPVSAVYHDHLFVPSDKAELVLEELKVMAGGGSVVDEKMKNLAIRDTSG